MYRMDGPPIARARDEQSQDRQGKNNAPREDARARKRMQDGRVVVQGSEKKGREYRKCNALPHAPLPCSRFRRKRRSRLRSEEHTSELQSRENLVCRLLLEKKKQIIGSEI